jgi:rubrerythrin
MRDDMILCQQKVAEVLAQVNQIVIGKEAPEICPVCSHPKAYFEIKAENY